MHGSRLLVLALLAALVAALAPAAASASSAAAAPDAATATAAAKKKTCTRGTKRVKVKRNGKARYVCRKKKAQKPAVSGPAGPSVAEVEAAISGVLKAQRDSFLPESAIEVRFDRPTQILPMQKWDMDPSTSLGEMDVFPVRAWVTHITHQDDTPADDTRYTGCNGHLDSTWPYDSIFLFYPSSAGGWEWRTDTAKGIGC